MTTVRHARLEADRPIIVEMVGRFLGATPYGKLLTFAPERLEPLVDQVLALGAIFLAERDGLVIGMIAICALESPISGDRYAEELVWWVNEEARSSSAGPKLLRAAEAWTRQAGLFVLKMVAPAGSTVGGFYERTGYAAVETSYIKRF